MRSITLATLLISVAAIGTGAVSSSGVLYYQGFPLPWFCDLGLIFVWLRLRRDLDYELEQGRQSET